MFKMWAAGAKIKKEGEKMKKLYYFEGGLLKRKEEIFTLDKVGMFVRLLVIGFSGFILGFLL